MTWISANVPPARMPSRRAASPAWPLRLWLVAAATLAGCASPDARRTITIWHPMRPAERHLLLAEIERFESQHPELQLRTLYKDVEELRSAFQAAALAGTGPDLIYGPSDVLDTFHTMRIVQGMQPWLPQEERDDFIAGALTYLPDLDQPDQRNLVQVGDHLGNHLALVYNRQYIRHPPRTTDELVALAQANTLDEDGDGRKERYGLVWSFTEPYLAIPFLTGHGAWVFQERASTGDDHSAGRPALDTPQSVDAYRFIQALHNEYQVTPGNCDYDLADSLFKTGRAAMIINGDWSWADYLNNPSIDAAVAVLPVVSSTGLPMRPMVAAKGFSLNANSSAETAAAAMKFVRHMTSPEVQQRFVDKLNMVPTRQTIYDESLDSADPTYRASLAQLENGRMMPVTTELRAVWDAMKPSYQALLGGDVAPADAAAAMQRDAIRRIDLMHRPAAADASLPVLKLLGLALLVLWLWWQRKSLARFLRDAPTHRVAYAFVVPAMLVIFAVVVFPFAYNIVLSLSNMSLVHFKDWQVVGLQNYVEVFRDPHLWNVFVKTIVWTVVSVGFHLVLGLLLAVALHGPVRGGGAYRLMLIVPWAIPAYITALTWRSMFDYEYGAVNLILLRLQQFEPLAWMLAVLNLAAPVNWLGDPLHAFQACIVANVWLGFPFMMIIALGGMQGIPRELYEAAQMDGAGRGRQFWHITLPLLKPALVPAVTLSAIWTFNNLNIVWLVSNGGQPQNSTHILVSYVYKAVFDLYRYGYGAALSMVIFGLLLVTTLLLLGRGRATDNVYG